MSTIVTQVRQVQRQGNLINKLIKINVAALHTALGPQQNKHGSAKVIKKFIKNLSHRHFNQYL